MNIPIPPTCSRSRRIAACYKLRHRGAGAARHRTNVYRWLLRFVGNENSTNLIHLLSHVFFDAWQQAGRFEQLVAATTWLLSIARYKALSARRRRTEAELDETINNHRGRQRG